MIKKGDKVIIKGSAEEEKYKDCIFEVLSEPYNLCGTDVVKMKCPETGKYFGGGYAVEFLEVKKTRELQFIDEHHCTILDTSKIITISKRWHNGEKHWYWESQNNDGTIDADEILFCPYCGEKLEV